MNDKIISQPMRQVHIIKRILNLLAPRKKEALFLSLLVIISTGFDIGVPFIAQSLVDTLITFFKNPQGGDPIRILAWPAIGILAATIISSVARSFYDYRLFIAVTQIEDTLRNSIFEKYLRLHALFHHGSSSGQIIGRIERGASSIYTILHDILGHNLVPPLIVFCGIFITLFFKDPWIALAFFLPLPLYVASVKRITDKIYQIEKQANEQFEELSKEAYDIAGNVITVKKFHQEEAETAHHRSLQYRARMTQYSAERLWKVMENMQTLIATLGKIGVVLLGGYFVLIGKSTVGEFVLYYTLQVMAYNPLHQLSIVFPRFRRNAARVERLFGILDEPILVVDKPNAVTLPSHSESIEFRNVSFRYGETSRHALKNISVVIPAGKTAALVGRSGSGKTTFINLLLRSFDPERGSVFVDSYDLRNITRESLLNQIAVVPQEVDLFSRTILQNIAYGKPDVTDDAVKHAATVALANDFIMRTEHGYGTMVGERGIKLSGGERQRIGIARAVLRDPRILILDEATSHLDTESERLIAQATNALIQDRTTIIIAHRFSTILHADMILVFNDGILEAVGKHDEILQTSATYQRLYEMQFQDAA